MSLETNNWKDIKDVMESFSGAGAPHRHDDSKILPIYAHVSDEPVSLDQKYIEAQDQINSTGVFKGAAENLRFNYLLYVFKDLNSTHKNLITIEYVISEEGDEQNPHAETYQVPIEQKKLISRYTSTPFRIFETKNRHKKLLLFKEKCPMTLGGFKELLNTWAES
jgi:hypothetical protein